MRSGEDSGFSCAGTQRSNPVKTSLFVYAAGSLRSAATLQAEGFAKAQASSAKVYAQRHTRCPGKRDGAAHPRDPAGRNRRTTASAGPDAPFEPRGKRSEGPAAEKAQAGRQEESPAPPSAQPPPERACAAPSYPRRSARPEAPYRIISPKATPGGLLPPGEAKLPPSATQPPGAIPAKFPLTRPPACGARGRRA